MNNASRRGSRVFIVLMVAVFSPTTRAELHLTRPHQEQQEDQRPKGDPTDSSALELAEEIRGAELMLQLISLYPGNQKELPLKEDAEASLLGYVASRYERAGDFVKARERLAKLLERQQSLHGPESWQAADARLRAQEATVLEGLTETERSAVRSAFETIERSALLTQTRNSVSVDGPLQQGIDTMRSVFGAESWQVARGLQVAGAVCQEKRDPSCAVSAHRAALDALLRLLGSSHPDTAVSYLALGKAYDDLGRFEESATNYERGISALAKGRYKTQASVQTLLELAGVYSDMGNLVGERDTLDAALARATAEIGRSSQTTDIIENRLALWNARIGDTVKAEAMLEAIVSRVRQNRGSRSALLSTYLNNLATLKMSREPIAATALLEESLVLEREVGEQRDTTTIEQNLAVAYSLSGDNARAIELAERILKSERDRSGSTHPSLTTIMATIASLAEAAGDIPKALRVIDEAVSVDRSARGEGHPKTMLHTGQLADLLMKQGQVRRAAQMYEQLVSTASRQLEETAQLLAERQQLAMAQDLRHYLDRYLSAATALADEPRRAWEAVVAWKGAVLARRRAYSRLEDDASAGPLLVELRRVVQQLQAATYNTDSGDVAKWRREVQALSRQKEALESKLSRVSAVHRRSVASRDPESVRKRLPNAACIVDFLEYIHRASDGAVDLRLVAFVADASHAPRVVQLGAVKDIKARASEWRTAIGERTPAELSGRKLRDLVWSPVEEVLADRGCRSVLVSPDGTMGSVALSALPGRLPGTYLLEDWPVSIVPSVQLLAEASTSQSKTEVDPTLLVVGDVDYDSRAQSPIVKPSGQTGLSSAPRQGGSRFEPLFGTRGELASLEHLYSSAFGASGVTSLTKTRASESAVRALAPQVSQLHLATHGYFASAEVKSALSRTVDETGSRPRGDQTVAGFYPGLLSGLALAGANLPETEDDGILTAEEVSTLNLSNLQLAVLSACETGLGESISGEGVLGLQRAFHAAGARTVVASLWAVDDASTRDLMERFYDNMWNKRLPRLEALREAQLWMLQGRRARGLTAQGAEVRLPPYYWGAFVMSGAAQ